MTRMWLATLISIFSLPKLRRPKANTTKDVHGNAGIPTDEPPSYKSHVWPPPLASTIGDRVNEKSATKSTRTPVQDIQPEAHLSTDALKSILVLEDCKWSDYYRGTGLYDSGTLWMHSKPAFQGFASAVLYFSGGSANVYHLDSSSRVKLTSYLKRDFLKLSPDMLMILALVTFRVGTFGGGESADWHSWLETFIAELGEIIEETFPYFSDFGTVVFDDIRDNNGSSMTGYTGSLRGDWHSIIELCKDTAYSVKSLLLQGNMHNPGECF